MSKCKIKYNCVISFPYSIRVIHFFFLSLGEVGSGKTTLVAKLQGIEDYMKGRGLEYLYFSVHDDDIDGNPNMAAYLDFFYLILFCFFLFTSFCFQDSSSTKSYNNATEVLT